MKTLLPLIFALTASPAFAAVVGSCDWMASDRSIVQGTSSVYNGRVTYQTVDTGGEPVCCSYRVLIKVQTVSGTRCFAVGYSKDGGGAPLGYSYIEHSGITRDYDPKRGLRLSIPVEIYNDGNPGKLRVVNVRINLAGVNPSVRIE